jgi:4-amino-4-deoxy-L-arabinose transferase-like glycosyltransferase
MFPDERVVSDASRMTIEARSQRPRIMSWILLVTLLAVSGTAIVAAMRRNSTTFDEIVFIAAGARGYETGQFNLAPDHPPLMQYVYGLPAAIAGLRLPDESGVGIEVQQHPGYRYHYAARFFWQAGNDPERAAWLGRIPAVIMALGLVLVTFAFTFRHFGPRAALLAAALVAFLPDVLAHGGVAYSDLPVTLALFSAAWAIDEAVRRPIVVRGILAGVLTGLALAVKISAAALLPLAGALIAAEFLARRRRPGSSHVEPAAVPWERSVASAAGVAVLGAYAVLMLVYRGDFLLEQFRYGLSYRYQHMTSGHSAAAFLLGDRSTTGWWYFFPVAFLFKTSAGLHLLLTISLITLAVRLRTRPSAILTSGLRVVAFGIFIFGAILLTSSLNIGFRYALPMLPWVCVLAAAGTARAWETARPLIRAVIVAAVVWTVAFPLSYFPHFLSFISEYGPARATNHTVLADSSLDWGQGLLALRDFMREHDIPVIYLSYFGSALPAGYGIEHVPLASFFPLPRQPAPVQTPQWAAISATNLNGLYLRGDPFARFRDAPPHAVVANTILLYHLPSMEPAR